MAGHTGRLVLLAHRVGPELAKQKHHLGLALDKGHPVFGGTTNSVVDVRAIANRELDLLDVTA